LPRDRFLRGIVIVLVVVVILGLLFSSIRFAF
jgi:hypothetical protein